MYIQQINYVTIYMYVTAWYKMKMQRQFGIKIQKRKLSACWLENTWIKQQKNKKKREKKKKVCCVVFVYHIFTEASRKTPSKVTLLKWNCILFAFLPFQCVRVPSEKGVMSWMLKPKVHHLIFFFFKSYYYFKEKSITNNFLRILG